jgi:hypothetical protein
MAPTSGANSGSEGRDLINPLSGPRLEDIEGEMSIPADVRNVGTPHVCLFPGQLQLGGVGRNTLNLAEELLARGVRSISVRIAS